jgi:hypothetical protein
MEEEQILKFVPMEEEHPIESLTQWEMELKMLEDWLSSLEPEGGYNEISIPEDTFQHELQLEEFGMGLDEELMGVSLSEGVAKKQFSNETAELESTAEWPVSVTRDERSMGVQDDLSIEKHEELQPNRLHKENQSMKQLEEVIREISEMMLKSVEEVVRKKKMDRGEPA